MKFFLAARLGRFALISLAIAGASGAGTVGLAQAPTAVDSGSLRYPTSPRVNQIDDVNGVRVLDPYRWLENVTSPDVHNWVASQNGLTEWYLSQITKRREIRDRLTRAWSYSKVSAPFVGGERVFYYENSGLENQPTLYVQEHFDTPPRALIDANAFSKEGLIAIVDQAASPEGRYLAYAVSTQGSAWRVVRIREVRTKQDLEDELTGVKDSPLAWTKDERGFFYVRNEPGRVATNPLAVDGRQAIYYHRVGRSQADDRLVYENTESPSVRIRAEVSEDGQYLVITTRTGAELPNKLEFIDLDNPKRPNLGAPLVKLFDTADALYEFVASAGNVFYLRTTKGAPRGRLVGVDINTPDPNYWTTTIRETYDPLVSVRRIDDRFVAHRLRDEHSVLELYSLDGGARGTVPLPGIGTVTEMSARPEARELYFTFSSFLQPPTTYRYDLDVRSVVPFRETRTDSTLSRFETTQLFFTSKDGTRVPMFITARRGITLDGTHATLLTAEGAFNAAMTPSFSPEIAAWLELGGIYAVANIRGGTEQGKAWHEAAIGAKKPVSLDDFLSAADFLVNQRYTKPGMLAVSARGHGATLVAAAVVRRPELFGAALLDAGVFDMARFNRFTVGPWWTPEYGSPDRPDDLRALLGYSPLHNVKSDRAYPATLITVGSNDDVVTPIHSYKLAAALQAAQRGPAPVLLRVDYDMGFGPGAPTAKLIALNTDRLTFLLNALRPPH